ncbi:transcriptional regulator NanR [Hydrogenophaga sp. T4]|nr:transcriptional regulator NanR [Hydrogenophaga sp. T4]
MVVPTADLLIEQIAGGAQHMLRMEPGMLEHLKDARVFLEAGLCQMAAQKATQADKERLLARWEAHHAALNEMDQFLYRDMLFHREIASISGNPIFPAIVEACSTGQASTTRTSCARPAPSSSPWPSTAAFTKPLPQVMVMAPLRPCGTTFCVPTCCTGKPRSRPPVSLQVGAMSKVQAQHTAALK